jgi:Ca-activated chloride channel family protein
MVIAGITIATILLCGLAEWLHTARCRRMARLAFGPTERPRMWVAAVPWLRAAAAGAACWALLVLIRSDGGTWEATPSADKLPIHHLAIALDVSPSMQLTDAGPTGNLRRAERARDVLNSVFQRLDMRRTRVSILAFYNGARPVVIDAYDPEVIANIINDLPLEHAFTPGKTNMYDGVKLAAESGKNWAAKSAALVVISDGDTLPAKEPPALPAAFAGTLVLGIGNSLHGLYIDGHSSRQDADSLGRLAMRLGGTYCDTNVKHVPSVELAKLESLLPGGGSGSTEMRDVAIAVLLAAASVLALLPVMLTLAGRRSNLRHRKKPADCVGGIKSDPKDRSQFIPRTQSEGFESEPEFAEST